MSSRIAIVGGGHNKRTDRECAALRNGVICHPKNEKPPTRGGKWVGGLGWPDLGEFVGGRAAVQRFDPSTQLAQHRDHSR